MPRVEAGHLVVIIAVFRALSTHSHIATGATGTAPFPPNMVFENGHIYFLEFDGTNVTLARKVPITLESASAPLWTTLAEQLLWLRSNARSGGNYVIELSGNESLTPAQAALPTGRDNVTITLRGKEGRRVLNLSSNGNLFDVVSGVTLVVDNNVTLMGRGSAAVPSTASNNAALVSIRSGGILVMREGARITGNTNSECNGGGVRILDGGVFNMNGGEVSGNTATPVYFGSGGGRTARSAVALGMAEGGFGGRGGGGVYVSSGGMFNMRNGIISGNTSVWGGGVRIEIGGTFRISNGVVYGYNKAVGLRNTAPSGASLSNSGVAQHGTFCVAGVFTSLLGTLSSTRYTIEVINGVLIPQLESDAYDFCWTTSRPEEDGQDTGSGNPIEMPEEEELEEGGQYSLPPR